MRWWGVVCSRLNLRAVTWCCDALQEFKAGKNPIMLATDVAARGLGTARTHSALQVNNLVDCIVALTPHFVISLTALCVVFCNCWCPL